jgi:hypothetical protein
VTRWPGQWPGAWSGDWQGGQEASPLANMAMRVTAYASVTATLEAVGGGAAFADMAMLAQGAGELLATISGGEEQLAAAGGAALRRRRPMAFVPVPLWAQPAPLPKARRRRREAEALVVEAL